MNKNTLALSDSNNVKIVLNYKNYNFLLTSPLPGCMMLLAPKSKRSSIIVLKDKLDKTGSIMKIYFFQYRLYCTEVVYIICVCRHKRRLLKIDYMRRNHTSLTLSSRHYSALGRGTITNSSSLNKNV